MAKRKLSLGRGLVPHNHENDHAMKSPNLSIHCLVPKKNIAQISQPRREQIRRYSRKNSTLHERAVKNSKNHDNGFRLFSSFDKKNVTFNTLIHQANTQVKVDVSQTHVQYSPR